MDDPQATKDDIDLFWAIRNGSSTISPLTVAQHTSSLRASLDAAQAELAQARARLAEAERDRDRIERQAVGRFILASALTYSLGAWSGVEVVADMLKCAGITKDEVDEQGWHQRDRKKLFSMIDQARAAQSKERE